MKNTKFLLFAGLVCLLAVGCHKDTGMTLDKFLMGNTDFKAKDDSKVALQFSSNRLLYEEGDVVKVNGETFTLSKSGSGSSTVWYANGNSIEATQFYCAYADGVSTTLSTYSGSSYHFDLSGSLTSATNKVLMGGVTENNVLTLRPACAIIRVPLNNSYSNVKVGFEKNKVYKKGTLNIGVGDVTISGTEYMTGVDQSGLGADFLMMEYNTTEGYWYVAVPVSSSITTKLYFYWEQGGSSVGYVTSGAVTLTKGYVYTAGSSRQSPFNTDGTSKCFFKVKNGMTGYVSFSPGNLQAKVVMAGGAHTEWQFASAQFGYMGSANTSNILNAGSLFDLFGFGTSDWSGSGAEGYNSWSASDFESDYIQQSLVGSYANADWGVYNGANIKYGTAASGTTWRTLTSTEWNYLLNTRSGKGALATVNGTPGIVLLPDLNANSEAWVFEDEVAAGPSFTAGYTSYSANNYSLSDWNKLEAAGVIFLPAAGYRYGPDDEPEYGSNSTGYYWSSTYNGGYLANALKFSNSGVTIASTGNTICNGYSVRLVHQQW